MALDLVVLAILLAAASSLAALCPPPSSARGQRLSAALMVLAMTAGIAGALARLLGAPDSVAPLPWQAAGGGLIGLDALSAFFLPPVFLVGGLGSFYGLSYWPRAKYPGSAPRLEFFWGLLVAGLGLLVIARQALSFLLGWEIMALSAFFLVSVEDFKAESRRAGLVYFVSTHVGTLLLFGLFALLRRVAGSFSLAPGAGEALGIVATNALFLLALLAFGLKAGLMPLHFWLPGAHANAPSQVSAMLSGVVLKMGVYGLLRFLLLFPDPPTFWGPVLLGAGALSGLLGVVFAIGQHDLKRLLAYHSVENIGIIFMGMGLALLGRAGGDEVLFVLGLSACLLHVWNHALFKSLLFLGAGSVLRATHTREIGPLGGLARPMPATALSFLLGSVAICGLPPLNGFVSEFLLYLGLFRNLGEAGVGRSLAALAAPVLAAIGALALACFVKVYGAVFLGNARTERAAAARESPAAMRLPFLVLAGLCLLIGLAPSLVVPLLDEVVAAFRLPGSPASPGLAGLAPLGLVGSLAILLCLSLCLLLPLLALARRRRRRAGTWDCGYAAPDARMQYSASSFAASLVELFSWVLKPRVAYRPVRGDFPWEASLETHIDDAVLDRFLLPAYASLGRISGWFRRFQQGLAQDYILFILVTLLALLATLVPFREIAARILAR